MISRLRLSAIYIAAATAAVLTVELGFANPRTARAEQPYVSVTLVHNGVPATVTTTATDVAGLLAQQNVTLFPGDYLSMLPAAPIEDGSIVAFGDARRISIMVDGTAKTIDSGAPTVASALIAAGIVLGKDDQVQPDLASDPSNGVRIVRVKSKSAAYVHHVRHVPAKSKLWALVLRAHEQSEAALYAVQMIATAYVPWCYGCSGVTKSGLRAGRGVVAVDPNVIPLGTRLYIPGYGPAVAGDTGGAIVGRRIDLGYENYAAAVQFGRRAVTVYVLH